MSEEYGPDFVTLTDEEGNDIDLEYIDTIEYNGNVYMAFFPVIETDEDSADGAEDELEEELIILRVAPGENGEDDLVTVDDESELDEVYDKFMEVLFADEEEDS